MRVNVERGGRGGNRKSGVDREREREEGSVRRGERKAERDEDRERERREGGLGRGSVGGEGTRGREGGREVCHNLHKFVSVFR